MRWAKSLFFFSEFLVSPVFSVYTLWYEVDYNLPRFCFYLYIFNGFLGNKNSILLKQSSTASSKNNLAEKSPFIRKQVLPFTYSFSCPLGKGLNTQHLSSPVKCLMVSIQSSRKLLVLKGIKEDFR